MSMTYSTSSRGYTLLELIVSLGIFSMVMLVVMGAYVSLISLDRQARANNQLAASLSFAIETMARSMRTGSSYDCGDEGMPYNCQQGRDSISFVDSQNQTITYELINSGSNKGSIGQCTGSLCTDVTLVPLTDPKINITALTFYVRGVGTTGANGLIQPNVTFTISGTMTTDGGETTSFSIQTSATQRAIEL